VTEVDYDQPTTLDEPQDGALVIVEETSPSDDGEAVEYTVLWRDDALAAKYAAEGSHPDERWFSDPEDDGRTWASALKYADHVHVLLNPEASRIEVTR